MQNHASKDALSYAELMNVVGRSHQVLMPKDNLNAAMLLYSPLLRPLTRRDPRTAEGWHEEFRHLSTVSFNNNSMLVFSLARIYVEMYLMRLKNRGGEWEISIY